MEHLAQCKREVCPERNLSSGAMTVLEAEEMGIGVRERMKGLDEDGLTESVDIVEVVESLLSVEA